MKIPLYSNLLLAPVNFNKASEVNGILWRDLGSSAPPYDPISGDITVDMGLYAVHYGDSGDPGDYETVYPQEHTPVTIDASEARKYGNDEVTIVKGGWDDGFISFTKSKGTASTQDVALSYQVGNYNHLDKNYGVTIKDGSATALEFNVVATDAYSAGDTDGINRVHITKGGWNSGSISFTKSVGTADTKTVDLSERVGSYNALDKCYGVTIKDGSATALEFNVGATDAFNAGADQVTIDTASFFCKQL